MHFLHTMQRYSLLCEYKAVIAPFDEQNVLSCLNALATLAENHWTHIHRFISRFSILFHWGPGGSVVKNLPANSGVAGDRFDSWVRKILWRRKWQPTLVSLPGKFLGQRNLVGYSPWGRRRAGHDWATEHDNNVIFHSSFIEI